MSTFSRFLFHKKKYCSVILIVNLLIASTGVCSVLHVSCSRHDQVVFDYSNEQRHDYILCIKNCFVQSLKYIMYAKLKTNVPKWNMI